MGYRAGNKKEYIKQMTVWLQQQESVHQFFSQFLKWAAPCDEDSELMQMNVNEKLEDVDEGREPYGGSGVSNRIQTEVTQTKVTHHVAKKTRILTLHTNLFILIFCDCQAEDITTATQHEWPR